MAGKRIGLAERRSQEARRPVDALFGTVAAVTESDMGERERPNNRSDTKPGRTLIRQTYHMDPVIVEAIRIMEFDTREGISAMVNRFLQNNIPEDVIKRAEDSLERRSRQKSN